MPPVTDIGAACLDDEGHAKLVGNSHRGGTVGIIELRVDHIGRDLLRQSQHGVRDQHGIPTTADAGDHAIAWAMNGEALTQFDMRQIDQAGIAAVTR